MNPPSDHHVEVPAAAVKAAWDILPSGTTHREVDEALQAAAPSIRAQAAEEERKRQERYAASEREEATRLLLEAERERDQAAQQERERIEAALKDAAALEALRAAVEAALATLKEDH